MGTTERTMQIKDSDWRKVATLVMLQNRMRDVVSGIETVKRDLGIPKNANYFINEAEATIIYTATSPERVPEVPGEAAGAEPQGGDGTAAEGPENASGDVLGLAHGNEEDTPAVGAG